MCYLLPSLFTFLKQLVECSEEGQVESWNEIETTKRPESDGEASIP